MSAGRSCARAGGRVPFTSTTSSRGSRAPGATLRRGQRRRRSCEPRTLRGGSPGRTWRHRARGVGRGRRWSPASSTPRPCGTPRRRVPARGGAPCAIVECSPDVRATLEPCRPSSRVIGPVRLRRTRARPPGPTPPIPPSPRSACRAASVVRVRRVSPVVSPGIADRPPRPRARDHHACGSPIDAGARCRHVRGPAARAGTRGEGCLTRGGGRGGPRARGFGALTRRRPRSPRGRR